MASMGLLARSVARLAEETAAAAARFAEMGLRIVLADVEVVGGHKHWRKGSDEVLLELGGRWDRRVKNWIGDARLWCTLRLHRGQAVAARWLVSWLQRFAMAAAGSADAWEGFRRVWSAMLIGGRRSGKSHLACVALIAFTVMVPRSLVWTVSPRLEAGEELDRALAEILPSTWYTRREQNTGNATTYQLANGSKIILRSGHKAAALKQGRVDLVLLNEAQLIAHRAFMQVRGAIADRGGLVLITANPPDTPVGRWVEEYFNAVTAAEPQLDGIAFELDPRNNPWIEFEVLSSMEKETDEKTYKREVLGMFAPIGDVVFHAWSDRDSWRDPAPHLVDITAEVTRREFGRAAGYVVGMDFQLTPHMAAAVIKVFRDPDDDSRDELAFVVDEVLVENADESDLLDALEQLERWKSDGRTDGDTYRGWVEATDDKAAPVHCAVVADASGWFQDGAHTKGRTSDRVLASRRWTFAHKPQKESDRNPDLVERVKCGNARLKVASGRRRLFVARHCIRAAEAMRRWEIKNGLPYRRSDFAHICDAVTYPVYRLWGRPKVKQTSGGYQGIPIAEMKKSDREGKVVGNASGRDRVKGW